MIGGVENQGALLAVHLKVKRLLAYISKNWGKKIDKGYSFKILKIKGF